MNLKQSRTVLLLVATSINLVSCEVDEIRWSTNARESNSLERSYRVRREADVVEAHNFNANQRDVAVKTHNAGRRSVSPPSSDMTEMSWDDELAKLALAYSQECVFEHNPSRSHSRFSTVGENIYISTGKSFNKNYVQEAIEAWDGERVYYNYIDNSCVPGEMCGHYTQNVWSSTFRVGCGAATCDSVLVNGRVWSGATILVCNYGPAGNIVGMLPYKAGNEPCSDCENIKDVCENKLCYNPSRLTTPSQASWLPWKEWGECSESCGGDGRRYRSRQCSTYVLSDCDGYSRQYDPYCASKPCEVASTETVRTTTTKAATTTTKTAEVTESCDSWTEWSSCSATCGSGRQERSRVCVKDYGSRREITTYTQIKWCRIAYC